MVETPNYIYIFEFKRDGSAEEALKQIEDMGYAREYAADGRKIYQIGCNFSSKTGTIDGWKVKQVIANEYFLCVILHSENIKIDKEGDGLCQKRRFSDARNVGTRP